MLVIYKNRFYFFIIFFLSLIASGYTQTIKVVNWNLLNFPGTTGAARETYFRTVLSQLNPDILVCQEMISDAGAQQFLNNILNSISPGKYAAAQFINGPDSDNILYYNTSIVQLISQAQIPTDLRDISEYLIQITSGISAGTYFRVYSLHLKAGSTTDDKNKRYQEATVLRNYLNVLPSNSLFLVCGDFNIQSSSESSFQILTGDQEDNDGRTKDPINLSGTWYNNSEFASIHTQSTRDTQFGGGASGGLDDRFDFILTSYALDTDYYIRYIDNSYLAYGNDGNHFNQSINAGTNYAVGNTVANALYNASDHLPVVLEIAPPSIGTHSINLSRKSLSFGAARFGVATPSESIYISSTGSGILNWNASKSDDWISISPSSGIGAGILTVGISRTDLDSGYYHGTVTISDPNATNSPQNIDINFHVYDSGWDNEPFGMFDTPTEGATVASSIPVTGWALDDIGLQYVKIYRTGSPDRIYIGDAVFVEGARPDVQAAFPDYPQNSKAGWGYMMLTNFLPDSGNGTFTILAYATDLSGNEVLLGTKTISCDNANAVLPFGAIDTPSQGGVAFGNSYYNFGWALTPQPNMIPTDGSTLTVWIDGVPLGHPSYNHYRADIATLFPGYANAIGAIGVYNIDTTSYTNGVHTIAWSAMDSAGNLDGIGSRYFSISNISGTSNIQKGSITSSFIYDDIPSIPKDSWSSIYLKRGPDLSYPAERIFPNIDNITEIIISELTRVAVYLEEYDLFESAVSQVQYFQLNTKPRYTAFENTLGTLGPLPVGSSFDSSRGIFYWQPGPGFLGRYKILIIDSSRNILKTIFFNIVPKY